MTLTELRQQRERLIAQAGEIVGPNNEIAPERREEFDRIMAELETNRAALEVAERVEQFRVIERTTLPESQRQPPAEGSGIRGASEGEQNDAERRALYGRALTKYLRGTRWQEMEREEVVALRESYHAFDDSERRNLTRLTDAAGGFTVPEDTRFYGAVVLALKEFGGMRRAGSEVITTSDGRDLPIPTSDDTANVGAIIAEEGSHTGGTSPTFGQKILKSFLYSSKTIKVSWQFLQDTAIDVETWLGARLGERLARIQNTHFTTGDGTAKPKGIMADAATGRTTATGFTTDIEFDDVYRLIHSVNEAYRTDRARWMFSDDTALKLRIAKDGNGRYLWPEMGSTQVGQPFALGGSPVVINNDVANMAASAKSMAFGDFSHYKIREARGVTVVRLDELFVENGQVGFLAFLRADGVYVNSGDPVKILVHAAT